MQIEAPAPSDRSMWNVERAHAALNAAYNSLADDTGRVPLVTDIGLAQQYVREARTELAGHDGPTDASVAARAVLPRIEHALQLLDALGMSRDPRNVAPLLDELGGAMDHVEAALAAVGWD